MKKYDKYKDSGIEWIGEIPEHWGKSKSKHFIEFQKGLSIPEEKLSFEEVGLQFLRTNDVFENSTINKEKRFFAEQEPEKFVKKENDFLICFDGFNREVGTGTVGLFTRKGHGIFSGHLFKISKKSDSRDFIDFFTYFLGSRSSLNFIVSSAVGAIAVSSANKKGDIPICVPPLEEQITIANFLDEKTSKIDAIISKKKEMIAKLKEYRQSLISETVTKGLDKNVKMKDSGIEWIGELPEHWEIRKFKNVLKVLNGREPLNITETGIDVYGSGGVFKKTDKYLYNSESVLFGRKGTIGKPIFIQEPFWTVDTMFYTHFKKGYSPKFFFYALSTFPWDTIKTQTTLPSIVGTSLEGQGCSFPQISEQVAIANFLDEKTKKIDLLIEKQEEQIKLYEEYRQSLISETVTGKRKVDI